MSDVAIGWIFGVGVLAVLDALAVVAGRMVWGRYRFDPLPLTAWMVVLICVPFLGVVSWLIWSFWISPVRVSHLSQ
jgi:hypothetical protein